MKIGNELPAALDIYVVPEATEEEMDWDKQQVLHNDYEAEQYLYDADTTYRCASLQKLDSARAFWLGLHNCQVNTPESDAVAKAKTEWIQVDGAPFIPKVTDG